MNDGSVEPKKRQGERNPGASLQQKLRNHAKLTGDDMSLVLARYINERFLYRLGMSPYREMFILRGATLFVVWDAEPHRATRDIDLLATGDNSPGVMRNIVSEICELQVEADGLAFLTDTLVIDERAGGRAYQGLHLEMTVVLSTARVRDFYDVWYLSNSCEFDGMNICDALSATFDRRQTEFPIGGLAVALSDEFAKDSAKRQQWAGFLGKARLRGSADTLDQVTLRLREFLQPPLKALAEQSEFKFRWSPEEGWIS